MTGTIIVDELRSVGVESSLRSSDPANPSVGDRWVRDDVTPTVGGVTAIGVVRVQGPNDTQDWPIISDDDESALGPDVYPGLRLYWQEFDGTVTTPVRGFVPVTDQGGSLGSPRLVHNGTEYQAHDALTVPAIPDSVVDNFEKVQYEGQNNTLSDYYTGSVSFAERQQNVVKNGDYALSVSNSSGSIEDIFSTSGLNTYPSAGDSFRFWFRTFDYGREKFPIYYGVQGSSNNYFVYINRDANDFAISGTGMSTFVNQSYANNTWYEVQVDWGSDGSMTATLYDSSGTQLNQVSDNDSTYDSGGIGFGVNCPNGDVTIHYDNYRLV